MKGSYLLVIKKENDSIIQIGKLGEIDFKKGYCLYVGSALNGLEQRIKRHLRSNKKTHWHIDYLLTQVKIIDVFYKENQLREECIIAKELEKQLDSIPGFGCSDCNCKSHLFYGKYKEIKQVIDRLNMKSYSCDANY
ncbi:MAG: GIY-YIG nuclease family protein [Thermoplasmatales archaeon]|nr:GIY-YIG nuclease family protein [Thermoplasmatales archaeon]